MCHFTRGFEGWNNIGAQFILHKAVAYRLRCIKMNAEEVKMKTV